MSAMIVMTNDQRNVFQNTVGGPFGLNVGMNYLGVL